MINPDDFVGKVIEKIDLIGLYMIFINFTDGTSLDICIMEDETGNWDHKLGMDLVNLKKKDNVAT
jgi:hypothetical protein